MEIFHAIAAQDLNRVQTLIQNSPKLLLQVSATDDAPILNKLTPHCCQALHH